MPKNIMVYSTKSCPYCKMLKSFLNEIGMNFQDYDIGKDARRAKEMVEKSGQMSVPVTDVDGRIIIGFDRRVFMEELGLAPKGGQRKYDLVIVGAGPAGITASIYASRKKMDFVLITKDIGGQTKWSAGIENYTGYQFITGPELTEKFRKHLEQFGMEIREGEGVVSVERKKGDFLVRTEKGEFSAKTVILASGRIPRKLGVEGEEKFLGRGVTYCATCDGPLFAGKEVAVVGGGNSALDATLQLIKIAKKIHVIDVAPKFRADRVMVEKAQASGKAVFHHSAEITRIFGNDFVRSVTVSQEGKKYDVAVEGVFIEIGSLPASEIAQEAKKNEYGEIEVNCKCETNVPGLFAAGDLTDVPAKQIIVAAGEGAKAAMSAFEYLSKSK
ncbi:MAG: FAD-dependent oxidoreductase [Candidatus Thermoplasmatota archaeon]|nr:FAD-dependent oxidoreductase [Candidatus Thermoplasmatota archaeon]